MVIINYIEGNEYFTLNDKMYPQIYQAVDMGATDIAIYNIHDIKNRILGNTHFSEVKVNDVQYPSQDELIRVLIPILYRKGASGPGSGNTTDWQAKIDQKEDKFNKNTAFNKNFGSGQNEVAEGNDPRFSKGTTAYSWGNHSEVGYLTEVAIPTIIDALNSTDTAATLSANQGRILKGYIDDINSILNSDDTTLDELQEIVNFIKNNQAELENLGISNIAGLQTALDGLQSDIDTHIADTTNPHNVTKSQVGLGNVNNTNDIDKPISNATQTALNSKEDKFVKNTAFNKDFGVITGTVKEGDWVPSWSQVTGKPNKFPSTDHTHTKSEITDFAHTHGWADVLNKPTVFPPAEHDHDADYSSIGHSHGWEEITGKPTVFTPAEHTHSQYLLNTGDTVYGNFMVDTSSGANGLYISRTGGYDQAAKHYVDDAVYKVEYTNDEAGATIQWVINNTDTEASDGTAANTTTLNFRGDANPYLDINGFKFWHEGIFDPSTKSDSGHTHDYSTLTGVPYIPQNTSDLTNDSGFITGLSWGELTGKPTTFTPSAHNHDADYSPIGHSHGWTEITGKPTTFTPSAHNHDDRYYTESEVDSKLAGKSDNHTHPYLNTGGGMMYLGEGLEFTEDPDYFGGSNDARIIRMWDGNSSNGNIDGGLVFDGKTNDGIVKELLVLRTDNTFTWMGNTIYHSGNLTKLSQLTNDSGYLSSLPSHYHSWDDISNASINIWGGLRQTTGYGWIDFGPANANHAHIYTDRPDFYFNKPITINGVNVALSSDIPTNLSELNNDSGYLTSIPSHNHSWNDIDGFSTNSYNSLRLTTSTGYLDMGSVNTSYAHFATDRPKFHFDKPISINGIDVALEGHTHPEYLTSLPSHNHNTLEIQDIRDHEDGDANFEFTPDDMPSNSISSYFGYVPGAGSNWRSILNLKGWGVGYTSWQLIGPGNSTSDDDLYFRAGADTTWDTPRKILHSGNHSHRTDTENDARYLQSLPSHDHSWNDINGFSSNEYGALRVSTGTNGYVDVGAFNTSYAHIYTDRPTLIFNKPLRINSDTVATQEWVNAQGFGGGSDGNNYPTGLTFNTSNGTISLSRNGLTTLTTDSLDYRYALKGDTGGAHTHDWSDVNGFSDGVNNTLRLTTPSGYIDMGAMNTSYAHIYTDRPSFYFNKDLRISGNLVATQAWVEAQGYGSGSGDSYGYWRLGANGSYSNVNSADNVNFVGSGATTVSRTGNTITISSTDTTGDGGGTGAHTHDWDDINGFSTNSYGALRVSTSTGYVDFGSFNSSYGHIYTDRPSLIMNKPLYAPKFYQNSLRELKENIEDYNESALSLVNDLNIVEFDYKEGEGNNIGIIADDTAPEFLSNEKDAVNLYNSTFINSKAIQELSAKVETQQKEIDELKEMVKQLMNK